MVRELMCSGLIVLDQKLQCFGSALDEAHRLSSGSGCGSLVFSARVKPIGIDLLDSQITCHYMRLAVLGVSSALVSAA
jgi:hypothetical protein